MLHHPAPPQEEDPGEVAAVVLNPKCPPCQLVPRPTVDVHRYHLCARGRVVRWPRDDAAGPEVVVALAQHLLVADGALCVFCVEAQPRQEAVPHAEVMLVHDREVAPQHEVVVLVDRRPPASSQSDARRYGAVALLVKVLMGRCHNGVRIGLALEGDADWGRGGGGRAGRDVPPPRGRRQLTIPSPHPRRGANAAPVPSPSVAASTAAIARSGRGNGGAGAGWAAAAAEDAAIAAIRAGPRSRKRKVDAVDGDGCVGARPDRAPNEFFVSRVPT